MTTSTMMAAIYDQETSSGSPKAELGETTKGTKISPLSGVIEAPGSKGGILSSKLAKTILAFGTTAARNGFKIIGICLAIWGALSLGKMLMGMIRKNTKEGKGEEGKDVISGTAKATA